MFLAMEIKLVDGCKLYTLSKKGVEEVSLNDVTVSFFNGRPTYKLKEGDQEQMVVQAYNLKSASNKMLVMLSQKNRK